MTPDFEKIINRITEIVQWYGKNNNPTPDTLMDAYKKITGYLWYFAEHVASTKGEYNQAYFMRKIETIREKDRLVKMKMAVNKADIEAMLSTEDQFMIEIEAETIAYKADLLLKQGNKVADCMRTHISLLKTEKDQTENR